MPWDFNFRHRNSISDDKIGLGFILTCFSCLLIIFGYMQYCVAFKAISLSFKILSCLADAGILIIPLLFLKRAWKLIILPLIAFFAIMIFANIIYLRNFGDIIAPSLYVSDFSNKFVLRSTLSSLKGPDLILAAATIIPVLYTLIFGWRKSVGYSLPRKFRWSVIICVVLCWGIGYVAEIRRTKMFLFSSDYYQAARSLFKNSMTDWLTKYRQHNFTGYLAWTVYKSFGIYHKLSAEDIEKVRLYLTESANRYDGSINFKDSLNTGGLRKNLIVIVVESLPSTVFDMRGAESFMPAMYKMTSDSSAVFVKDCEVLARLGRSSDAQFMINTGLTPLHYEVLVTNYASGNYPALAKAFYGNSMEVIGEYSSLWSHGLTNKAYGYDGLISGIAVDPYDQDSIIFKSALKEIKKMKEPFFMFISSLSMHNPYLTNIVSTQLPKDVDKEFPDPRDKEYLRRLLHFDNSLGEFIEALKNDGLFDNSVIVITGDHEIAPDDVSSQFFKYSVPIIILNSGMKNYRREEVTQLDIFPSILDALGIDYTYDRFYVPYRGLGKSIFVAGDSYHPSDDDYAISELIIRSPD